MFWVGNCWRRFGRNVYVFSGRLARTLQCTAVWLLLVDGNKGLRKNLCTFGDNNIVRLENYKIWWDSRQLGVTNCGKKLCNKRLFASSAAESSVCCESCFEVIRNVAETQLVAKCFNFCDFWLILTILNSWAVFRSSNLLSFCFQVGPSVSNDVTTQNIFSFIFLGNLH